MRIKSALRVAGWRLPDDRMEVHANRCVDPGTLRFPMPYKVQEPGSTFKMLGALGVVGGTSHADCIQKQHICASAVEVRNKLWTCPVVSRGRKLDLMFKVASSSFCWCVGAWTVNSRKLSALRATLRKPAKSAMRVPRYWMDTEKSYHRRGNRIARETMKENRTPDIDVYVLGRMYDYAGHVLRESDRNSHHLIGHLLRFRNSAWKQAVTEVVGHQGHSGRISPWDWERQYHSYFRGEGLLWQDVALDKKSWLDHRPKWIRHTLGSRSTSACFGNM